MKLPAIIKKVLGIRNATPLDSTTVLSEEDKRIATALDRGVGIARRSFGFSGDDETVAADTRRVTGDQYIAKVRMDAEIEKRRKQQEGRHGSSAEGK